MRMRISGVVVIFCVLLTRAYGFDLGKLNPFAKDDFNDRQSRFSIGNVGKSVSDVATGVAEQVGKAVPTPTELFDSGKQLVAGYPFVVVSSAINQFCSAAIATDAVKPKYTPDITKMQFQLRNKCEPEYFPLLKAEQILKSPNFDPKKKVVVLASGWTTNANDTDMINSIGKAYLCRGDSNVIAVDSANFVDTLYSWSAFNTDEIGEHIAVGLVLIADVVPVENIHLIGHSLGAHIVGAAGRYFTLKTGKMIPRITGLDPAKPCFNEGENLSGLLRGDADFIDVIHSNPGVLGKREPVGDADFYAGGLSPLSPGCIDVSCAHGRAVEYYAETVYPNNEQNFLAMRCTSLKRLRDDKCNGKEYPMGYACPSNLKGNYFLEVNKESPYGVNGDAKRSASQKACGLCDKNKK